MYQCCSAQVLYKYPLLALASTKIHFSKLWSTFFPPPINIYTAERTHTGQMRHHLSHASQQKLEMYSYFSLRTSLAQQNFNSEFPQNKWIHYYLLHLTKFLLMNSFIRNIPPKNQYFFYIQFSKKNQIQIMVASNRGKQFLPAIRSKSGHKYLS